MYIPIIISIVVIIIPIYCRWCAFIASSGSNDAGGFLRQGRCMPVLTDPRPYPFNDQKNGAGK